MKYKKYILKMIGSKNKMQNENISIIRGDKEFKYNHNYI